VLWQAGVVASPVGPWLGAETDKFGKMMVELDLSVRDHPEVFVIGDTAHLSSHGASALYCGGLCHEGKARWYRGGLPCALSLDRAIVLFESLLR